jgi:chromosome segregation ATPase
MPEEIKQVERHRKDGSAETIFKLKRRVRDLEEKLDTERTARMRAEAAVQTPDERVKERDARIDALKQEFSLAEQRRREAQADLTAEHAAFEALKEKERGLVLDLELARKELAKFKPAPAAPAEPSKSEAVANGS